MNAEGVRGPARRQWRPPGPPSVDFLANPAARRSEEVHAVEYATMIAKELRFAEIRLEKSRRVA